MMFPPRPVVLYKIDGKFKGAYQNDDVAKTLGFIREDITSGRYAEEQRMLKELRGY